MCSAAPIPITEYKIELYEAIWMTTQPGDRLGLEKECGLQ